MFVAPPKTLNKKNASTKRKISLFLCIGLCVGLCCGIEFVGMELPN